ncbi:MAG: hypothetical protein JNL18_10765 [Planctomycetaceae bacterium]|nr:hypothetical protein [Planctomycetaceae bacterium]
MNGVWRSLLWKEWREQRFKLLAITLFTATMAAWPWLFDSDGTLYEAFIVIGFFCILSLGLFVGASLAASERSQRTVGFLQSLPYSTRRTAIAKLVVAALTVASPGVVLFGAVKIWESLGYIPANHGIPITAFAAIAWAAFSFAVWVAAIAANLADEVRAGAVGFLAVALFWGVFAVAVDQWLPASEELIQAMAASGPGGPLLISIEICEAPRREFALLPPRPIGRLVVLAAISTTAMTLLYVWRFGRVAPAQRKSVESTAKSVVPAWLAPPMRRPWNAILWKQCCESLPLSMLGAGAILCVSVFIAVANRGGQGGILQDGLLAMSIPVWILIGGLVSIVSGIGLWLDDLRPELHTFWRSRPIATVHWFALKFATSAIITLATLALPSLLIYGLLTVFGERPLWNLYGGDDWRMPVLLALVSQFGFFCVAAAFMAATRRPMVSALLTIFTAAGIALCLLPPFSLEAIGSAVVIAVVSTLATVVGWLCIRNDWAIGR